MISSERAREILNAQTEHDRQLADCRGRIAGCRHDIERLLDRIDRIEAFDLGQLVDDVKFMHDKVTTPRKINTTRLDNLTTRVDEIEGLYLSLDERMGAHGQIEKAEATPQESDVDLPAREIECGELVVFGIKISSRHSVYSEVTALMQFARHLSKKNLHQYILAVHFDSRHGYVNIDVCEQVGASGRAVIRGIQEVADIHFYQYKLLGEFGFGN